MAIKATNISKSYGDLQTLGGVDISVFDGEIVSIVGASGCGKSTLLNILAGIDKPDGGEVQRSAEPIGYLMQDSLLLPWRTLGENATLGIEVMGRGNRAGRALATPYFSEFDLDGAFNIYPHTASGGMRQRTAIIRTLLTMPKTLLLDEPFASLDFDIKLKIQRHLIEYHHAAKVTTVIVTHDIDDAIALSERVIVLSEKPARVKAIIPMDGRMGRRDPIEARKSPRFSEHFARLWDELRPR